MGMCSTHNMLRMTNVTLSFDDETLRKARVYAASHGTTLNQIVRDLLQAKVAASSGESPLEASFRLADAAAANSEGWRWNRAEIHGKRN